MNREVRGLESVAGEWVKLEELKRVIESGGYVEVPPRLMKLIDELRERAYSDFDNCHELGYDYRLLGMILATFFVRALDMRIERRGGKTIFRIKPPMRSREAVIEVEHLGRISRARHEIGAWRAYFIRVRDEWEGDVGAILIIPTDDDVFSAVVAGYECSPSTLRWDEE